MSEDAQTSKTEARTQAQRERILTAAHSCFIRQGFHAASMATIAETAGMSPGLIYRYFENKNAIILSIIERQLADARSDIATLRSDTDFISLFSELFDKWTSEDPELKSPALMLEMTAEASRDPQIGRALAESDKVTGSDFNTWLSQAARLEGKKPAEADVKARAFALRCLIGGLAIRAIREPDIEKTVLRDSLKLMLPHLLSFRA
ncbi:MAG TPA: TetR/AcrR family transcriptional regulator [Woeseiaceae bacterium]|nr:TetR/AcrR family transcriptional regulator [Woeseiaceae bacterium]